MRGIIGRIAWNKNSVNYLKSEISALQTQQENAWIQYWYIKVEKLQLRKIKQKRSLNSNLIAHRNPVSLINGEFQQQTKHQFDRLNYTATTIA